MVISDFKYPKYVEYQLGAGKAYIPCGWAYNYYESNRTTRKIFSGLVYTYPIAEYLITPTSPSYFAETDYFKVLQFPNGYSIRMKFIAYSNGYVDMMWRTFDDQDNELGSGAVAGMSGGRGSGSALLSDSYGSPFADFTACSVKVAGYTNFPLNTDVGVSASSFGFDAFFGKTLNLYLPSGEVIDEPVDYSPKTIKYLMTNYNTGGLFRVSSFDDLEAFMHSHGSGMPNMKMWEDGPPNETDPSKPGGGDGNYNDDSDPIDFPTNPQGGAMSCGAVHAFLVETSTIQQLFQKLWSTNIFDYATWQKLVQNPLDCIISLHGLPITPDTGQNPADIYIGNFNTELSAPVISSQWHTTSCGKLHLNKFFGTAMDYSEYTRIQIYLPFSGIHDLAPEDVQGSDIEVKYNIDVLTGDCVINVKCGLSVLYKFTGNMKLTIPITARDSTALSAGITGVAGAIGGAIKGGMAGGAAGAIAGGVTQGVLTTAASVATRRVNVSRSGNLTGSLGLMDEFRPYLIIHRPQQSLASDYNKFKGYPSNLTRVLSSCSGYTEVQHVHLTGISGATDTELKEIEQMLKAGVII